MLFVTNRRFKQGPSASLPSLATTGRKRRSKSKALEPRKVTFELDDNDPSNAVHFCERLGKGRYQEIYSPVFLERLKESSAKQVLLYIHGFSNLPEPNIFPRAQTLQKLCDSVSPGEIEVVSLIWPCDNDAGIIKDYWDDQVSADASAYGFARILGKFLQWRNHCVDNDDPCYKRINILAHSMGNRVLRGTLETWARDYGAVQGVFRNIFMMAADVVNETLEAGRSGEHIPPACRNLTVYYASDDFALRSSKVSNLKNKKVSRRLGHTGPEEMHLVPANVYGIDCDDFNNRIDSPTGHSYFLRDENDEAGPVLHHMMHSMLTGRVDADPATRQLILPRGYTSG